MTATLPAPTARPVQLTLDLRAPSGTGGRSGSRSYWDRADLADLGGELHARRPGVRAVLTAQRRRDGSWVGYHDLVLGASGTSGPTRPQSTRTDALVSAAYGLARHCHGVLARASAEPREAVTAARQLLRWLDQLGLV